MIKFKGISEFENEEIIKLFNVKSLESFAIYLSRKLIDLFPTRLAGNEEVCNKVRCKEELRKKVAKRLVEYIYFRAKKNIL